MCLEASIIVSPKSRIVKKKNLKKRSFTVLRRTRAITEEYEFARNCFRVILYILLTKYDKYAINMIELKKYISGGMIMKFKKVLLTALCCAMATAAVRIRKIRIIDLFIVIST